MEVLETPEFARWMRALRDPLGKRQIVGRIARIAAMGNFGDFASVGGGVSELRIHVGPGYRVYYTLRGEDVVILLAGGDKGSQERDMQRAKEMAARVK
ncbi:MAG: type II toxin-antitoxin system RelE/ParE family toxin [Allosphingosinicella sp.]